MAPLWSNDAITRTDVRAPSGSYSRTTTSPEPSSASLTASTYAVPSTRTSGSTGLPVRRRRGRFSAYPASAASAIAGAGHQRVPQHVPTLVGLRVGEQRRAQQAEPHPRVRAAARRAGGG